VVEALNRAIAEDRDRNRPESTRDEIVVRAIVFVDVVRRERHALS